MDPGVARLAGDGAWEDVRALVREAQGDLSADCAEALLARADPVTAAILLWLDGLRVSDEVVARLLADAAPGTRDVLRIEAERRARAREGSAAHAAHLARSGRVDALVAAALECEALISMNLGDGCRGIARVAAEAGREDGLGALVRHAGAPVVFGINDDTLPSQLHSLRERRRALVREGPRLFGRACARSDAIDLAAGRTQEPAGLLPRRSRPRGGVDARACRMDHLPLGAARCVLSFLPARALTCLSCCGRRWRNATQSPSVWARLVWPPAVLGDAPGSSTFAAAGLSCRRAWRGASWRPPAPSVPELPYRDTCCAEVAAAPWSAIARAQATGRSALCVHVTAAAVRWLHVEPSVGGVASGCSGPPAVCVPRRRQWGSPPPSWTGSVRLATAQGGEPGMAPHSHAVLRCGGECSLWTSGRGQVLLVALAGHLLRACSASDSVPSHLVLVAPYWLPAAAHRRLRWLLDSATPPGRSTALVPAPHAALCRVGGHSGIVVWLGDGGDEGSQAWACPVWRGQLLHRFAWPDAGAAAAATFAGDRPAEGTAAVDVESVAVPAGADADQQVIAALRRMLGRLSGALGQHAADDLAQRVLLAGPHMEARAERLIALAAESLRVCRLHPLGGEGGPWALARGSAALAMAWLADRCGEGAAAPPSVEGDAEARSAFAWHGHVLGAVGQEGPE